MTLNLNPYESVNITCGNFIINLFYDGDNTISIEEMKIKDESTIVRTKHTDFSYNWILQKTFEGGFDKT